jgi:hypothetical protein
MANQDVLVQVIVASDQDARHAQLALQNLANNFTVDELIKISKKIENPIMKFRIKSML